MFGKGSGGTVLWGELKMMDWLYMKGIPIDAQYLYRKGMEMKAGGRDEVALRYFRQALVIAPGYAKAMHEMGNSYANLGRYDEARIIYEKARKADPLLYANMPFPQVPEKPVGSAGIV
jgi:tetratricopeptide (TPR) repeat protein